MSAVSEHVEHHGLVTDESDIHHVPSDRYFIKVALVLAVLTALETSTYWIHLGGYATPLLLILMTIKFFMIVLIFMHLKFDNKLFGVLFYMGLALAMIIYLVFLATFKFFDR